MTEQPKFCAQNVVEFQTTQCKPLKILFDALKENVEETHIYFSTEGINIYSRDPHNTLITTVELLAENFDHYYCTREVDEEGQERLIDITISAQSVNKVLKTVSNDDDMISFTYNPEYDYVTLIISSNSKQEQRLFEIQLLEPDEHEITTYDNSDISDYSFILTMPCNDFQRICKDLKSMGVSEVTIRYQEDTLIFLTSSAISRKSQILRKGRREEMDPDSYGNETDLVFLKVDDSQSCYSDKFKFETLHSFSKCANIGSKRGKIVKIHLAEEQPIVLIFNVGSLGHITFLLSPFDTGGN